MCSDHVTFTVNIASSIDPIYDCDFRKKEVSLPNWRNATDLDKSAYKICTMEKLSNICIPIDALLCKQSNCTLHCKDIDKLYNDIAYALTSSGTDCIPISKVDKNSTFLPIAGWNEYVKEHYSIAHDALWWWKFHNEPKSSAIYHNTRSMVW